MRQIQDPARMWPLTNNHNIVITHIDDFKSFDDLHNSTVVLTEGWVTGPVAAILRGGANAKAALEVLARSGVKQLTIYHIEEKIPQLEDIFLSTVVSEASRLFESVNITWRHDSSVTELVKAINGQYSMLFFGAPLTKTEIEPFYAKLKKVFDGSVAIIRGPIDDDDFVEGDEIFKWVREKTFEGSDFSLPAVLRNGKKKLGVKIAVILPTLNEEKTVGKVIQTALEVKKIGLIDDVILIDSNSSDNTVAIAETYPISIFQHHKIRPEIGSYRGKGEAMFKSALVTDADILAWVDTDIENITPRFFYGLLGPILTHPEIRFVKGYFARPVRVEAGGVELGGGRVTEILAKPWINTYAPELSGFIQPLAGTVAIYRNLLYKMRIPANYGVEIAMLLQAVELEGLWATCQVNLGEVIHKSKDVLGLSEMAFQILQVLADMRNSAPHGINKSLRRILSTKGHFEIGLKRFETYWRKY